MTIDVNALGNEAIADGVDMTKAQTGGDFTPPAEGPCMVRLVGYVELGKQAGSYQGKPTLKDQVQLTFELSGKNHAPREHEGKVYPHKIVLTETLSLNEKARFFKLFQRLNYDQSAKHMVQLVGKHFKARVIHRKSKGTDGKERIWPELYDKAAGTYTIEPPRVEIVDQDETSDTYMQPTGEYKAIPCREQMSEQRVFLWNRPSLEQWASLFIEGEYEEKKNADGTVKSPAKSKNVIQNKIKNAANFKGSPIEQLLLTLGFDFSKLTGDVDPDDLDVDDQQEEVNAAAADKAVAETPKGDDADAALSAMGV